MDIRGLKTLKAALLGMAASTAFVLGSSQSADAAFNFQPFGSAAGGDFAATGFAPGQGNARSAGGVTAVNNFIAGGPAAGNVFTEYYQSVITGYTDNTGSHIAVGGANILGATYQITVVAKVNEVVTSASLASGTATFQLAANQTGSFLQMYENPTIVANPAAGTGFNAGALILAGTPVVDAATSNFTNNGTISSTLYSNDPTAYPGVKSVVGSGQTTIDFAVTPGSQNSNYFPGTPPPSILSLNFSSGTTVPFQTIEPSASFANAGFGGVVNLGAINGQSGPDFILQTAQGTLAAVPEPSSVCLMGLGLAGVVTYVRRKRNQDV